jgi:hypothetical protein
VVDTGLDVWERVQAVNLRSVFLRCKAPQPAPSARPRRLGRQHREL